jgi:hypothetical protein
MVSFYPCFVCVAVVAHKLTFVYFCFEAVVCVVCVYVFAGLGNGKELGRAVYVIPCEHDVVPVFAGHFAFDAFACFKFALDVVVADVYLKVGSVFCLSAAFEFDLSGGFEAVVSGV